jgi:hypothetical protein
VKEKKKGEKVHDKKCEKVREIETKREKEGQNEIERGERISEII